MDVSTAANSWVDSYLEALISAGSRDALAARTAAPGYAIPEAVDADRQICAKYYVNQILSLDEDSLRRSWNKVARANRDNQVEKDARIEYLSWRVWAMKRKRAAVAARQAYLRRVNAATAAEEDDESDERTALLYLDDLDTTVNLEPLTEEVDPSDPAAAQLLAEPLSADQSTVPDTDRPDDQSWDAVYPATAAAKQAAAAAAKAGRTPALARGGGGGGSAAGAASQLTVDGAPTSLASLYTGTEGGFTSTPSTFSAPPSSAATAATTPAVALCLPPASTAAGAAPAASVATSISGLASIPATAAAAPLPRGSGGGQVSPRATLAASMAPTPGSPTTAGGAVGIATSAAVPPPTEADLNVLVHRYPRLYVVLISLHGLVRGARMELGRDPDTGGQVKYVVELARALGRIPSVARVDLLTRLIADPKVDASYAAPQERLDCGTPTASPESSCGGGAGDGGSGADDPTGAFIVRLPCGPPGVYLRKEDLWPYIREFSDRALRHVSSTLARLAVYGSPAELWAVHGHYADAGEAAALMAATLGCPMLMTGHSLGRNKKAHLLASGSVSLSEIEATYRIGRRIEAEERALDSAAVVFTSTQQEVKEQWGLYDGYREQLAAALSQRSVPGLHVPAMAVIPPGLDFSSLKVSLPLDPVTQLLEHHRAATAAAQAAGGVTPRRGTPLPLTSAPSLEAAVGGVGGGGEAAGCGGTVACRADGDAPLLTAAATAAAAAVAAAAAPRAASAVKSPGSGASSPSGASASPPMVASDPDVVLQPPAAANGTAIARKSSPGLGSGSGSGSGCGSSPDAAATPPLRHPRPVSVRPVAGGGGGSAAGGAASPFASPPSPTRKSLMSSFEAEVAAAGGGGGCGGEHGAGGGGSGGFFSPGGSVGGGAGGGFNRTPTPQPSVFTEPPIWREVQRFLRNPAKPVILAMSRPDAKKNVAALVKAYGSSAVLRDLANLVLVLGNRDVIDSMATGSARVMESVLKLVDAYDLYGSVAYPKRHSQSDISDIYHLAAATRGVFVNVALQEPFGLTLIEAAAHGVPIVATCHGGPVDIVATLRNGVTVEPADVGAITAAITDIITRPDLWDTYSNNGRNNILAYSWPSHVLSYLRLVEARRAADPSLTGAGKGAVATPRSPGMVSTAAAAAGAGAAAGGAGNLVGGPGGGTGGGGGGGGAGPLAPHGACHIVGAPPGVFHVHLRTAFSLSYDDLAQAPAGGQQALPALGAALNELVSGRATSLPFELSPAVVAAAAAGLGGADSAVAAAVAAAAADLLRQGGAVGAAAADGASGGPVPRTSTGGGGGAPAVARRNSASFDANDPGCTTINLQDLQLRQPGTPLSWGGGGGGAETSGLAAANGVAAPAAAGTGLPPMLSGGGGGGGVRTEVFPGARLALLGRGPGAGGRWVFFCCDCAADLVRAGGALAALAAGRREAAERGLGLRDVAGLLRDDKLAALLRHALAGYDAASGATVPDPHPDPPAVRLGLGVLSCLGRTDTRTMLEAGGADLSELDVMTCNNACQLWLAGVKTAGSAAAAAAAAAAPGTTNTASSPGGSAGGEAAAGGEGREEGPPLELLFDERYERNVEHRWEATAAKQVVRRILSNRGGWRKLPLGRSGHPPPRISALGPYHIMVTFTGAAARDVDPAVLTAAFRRKLRLSGLRAQLVVTPPVAPTAAAAGGRAGSLGSLGVMARLGSLAAPECAAAAGGGGGGGADSSGSTGFTLHVVPLRCSRALALRYLSYRYGIPLEDMTLAAFCISDQSGGGGGGGGGATSRGVTLHCSDAEDLVAGQPRVALLSATAATAAAVSPPAAAISLGQCAAGGGGGGFQVDLTPYMSSGRILLLS